MTATEERSRISRYCSPRCYGKDALSFVIWVIWCGAIEWRVEALTGGDFYPKHL